jgi:DNA modification methylase
MNNFLTTKKLEVSLKTSLLNNDPMGFIFVCTDKSEKYLLESLIFPQSKAYGHRVFAVKPEDYVFLYNLDANTLYGPFIAESEGQYDPSLELFSGRYPYYVKVKVKGEIKKLGDAGKVLSKMGLSWRDYLTYKGVKALVSVLEGKAVPKKDEGYVDRDYRPPIFATTLWDYPKQSYGNTPKGDNKYPGVTPAFIIYNLLWRYTKPGDLVCDPMAGSGTTIDVCKEERRRFIAFDIVSTRKDIIQADARALPLKDNTVDLVFIDPPYGDNIRYNDHPLNIGHIPATEERFYDELEKVMVESKRILKENGVLAWLIGDQWAKGIFVPVGLKIYERLTKHFEPIDIVCIVRRNQASNTPFWQSKALQHNFFLRGFKYLIIVRKSSKRESKELNIKWNFYER